MPTIPPSAPSLRSNATGDLVAGLSVAGLLLPEAVAYSTIAGLTPEHALYAAVAGLAVYAVAGRSRFAVVAPTSSSAAIVAAAIASFPGADDARRLTLVFGLVLFTGLVFLVAGAARLGGLASFISRPVLRGFAFGLAWTIVIKQLPLIAGVKASGGPASVVWFLAAQIDHWNATGLALGAVALAVLFLLKRFPLVPGAFVALALGIGASMAGRLCDGAVACVGAIDAALPVPGVPTLGWNDWSRLAQLAVPLAMIVYAESWGAMRAYALRHGEPLDASRELLALGCANVASGLLRGMPVGAGFSATSANEAAGARSRMAGAAAAAALVALIAFGARFIALLPEPVLAAVVVSALAHALDPKPLLRLWRIDRDQYVAAGAALAVLAFGVLDGMLIAVALSLAAVIERFSRPAVALLGQLGDSHDFVDVARHADARTDPAVAVYRPTEPLFFANCERVFAFVERAVGSARAPSSVVLSIEESDDFDSTALEALVEFERRLAARGQTLFLARIKDPMRELLAAAGAPGLAGAGRAFFSVADAARAAREAPSPPVTPSA
jgi:MFS superfamily sulfate permease-like transporter